MRLADQLAVDSWVSESRQYAEAVALLTDLIGEWEGLLGHRHPYTLISRYRLVLAVAGTGARTDARKLLADLAADDAVALGEHHPYTRHVRELLTRWEETPVRP